MVRLIIFRFNIISGAHQLTNFFIRDLDLGDLRRWRTRLDIFDELTDEDLLGPLDPPVQW
jgi:hypothetical protein